MTVELTSEERKALLTAINAYFENVPDERPPESMTTDRTLAALRVRLHAFDPEATQKIRALYSKSRHSD